MAARREPPNAAHEGILAVLREAKRRDERFACGTGVHRATGTVLFKIAVIVFDIARAIGVGCGGNSAAVPFEIRRELVPARGSAMMVVIACAFEIMAATHFCARYFASTASPNFHGVSSFAPVGSIRLF